MDSPMYEQPTEPQDYINSIPGEGPAPGVPTTSLQAPGPLASPAVAPSPAHPNSARVPSRRRFMGKSIGALASLGGAGVGAAIGGVALEQWIQHRTPAIGGGQLQKLANPDGMRGGETGIVRRS